jgi:VCBS repeat-containing protein
MGDGVRAIPLEPVAYDGTAPGELPAIVLTDLAQLTGVLSGTVAVPGTGNLITEGLMSGGFGADGAGALPIAAISHDADGNPATPNVVYDTSSTEYDAGTNTLTITTHASGTLSVNFATGAYSYTAPDNVTANTPEVFTYTIQDADGDQKTGNFTITVQDSVPVANVDVATATEGYWTTGSNVSESVTLSTPASWSESASSQNVSGSWTADPSNPGGAVTTNTSAFILSADASHPASVSVSVKSSNFNSGDALTVALYNATTSTMVGSAQSFTADGTATFSGITQNGTYYVRVVADDNTSSGNFLAKLQNLS